MARAARRDKPAIRMAIWLFTSESYARPSWKRSALVRIGGAIAGLLVEIVGGGGGGGARLLLALAFQAHSPISTAPRLWFWFPSYVRWVTGVSLELRPGGLPPAAIRRRLRVSGRTQVIVPPSRQALLSWAATALRLYGAWRNNWAKANGGRRTLDNQCQARRFAVHDQPASYPRQRATRIVRLKRVNRLPGVRSRPGHVYPPTNNGAN